MPDTPGSGEVEPAQSSRWLGVETLSGTLNLALRACEVSLRAQRQRSARLWRRGARVGRSVVAVIQGLVCEGERGRLGVLVVVYVPVCPVHRRRQHRTIPRLPFRLRTQLLLTSLIGHTRGCRTAYVTRLSSSPGTPSPHPPTVMSLAASSRNIPSAACIGETLAALQQPRACESMLACE
jgi:hypothetical protein